MCVCVCVKCRSKHKSHVYQTPLREGELKIEENVELNVGDSLGERNKTALLELLQSDGNGRCADCQASDPDWASHTLGVFICLNCSGIHRNIPQISKVKSVRMDEWDSAQIEINVRAAFYGGHTLKMKCCCLLSKESIYQPINNTQIHKLYKYTPLYISISSHRYR
uniref:Arf-GAP domain-containing protein n=1 Tax=Pseudonaja textilis TaxID=8673 RepID=A0A670ZNT8_PSETE